MATPMHLRASWKPGPLWRTQQDASGKVAYPEAAFAGLLVLVFAHFSYEHNQNCPSL